MNDIFVEQLVERKKDSKSRMKKIALIIGGIILTFLSFEFLFSLSFILIALIWFMVYFFYVRENVEYEYSFTSGELDIDKIMNRSKRKHMLTVDVREFEIMVKKNLENDYRELNNFTKSYDYSSGEINENVYIAVFRKDKERVKLTFEPNEKTLNSIRMYIPNKVKR